MIDKKQSKRNVCLYDPKIAQELGLNAAAILERIRFLSERAQKSDGWFRCSMVKMGTDLGISRVQVKRARDQLVVSGLIETSGDGNIHFFRYIANEQNKQQGVQNDSDTGTKSTTEGYKIDPLYIRENIDIKNKREEEKTESADSASQILDSFRSCLPETRKPKRLTKQQKTLLIKAKHQQEFDEFWAKYKQAHNEKLKPLNISNSIGEKSKAFQAWCDRREEGFDAKDLASAIKVFFLSELNMAASRKNSRQPFCNRKLQNWLKESENVSDALDSREQIEEDAKVEAQARHEELFELLNTEWLMIEGRFAHQPASSKLFPVIRDKLAREWANFWNNAYDQHGVQFAGPNLHERVEPEQFLVSNELHEGWVMIIKRKSPEDLEAWENAFQFHQRLAMEARGIISTTEQKRAAWQI